MDDAAENFSSEKEIVCAVIEGRLSYKKFQKHFANPVDAAKCYADNVYAMFNSSQNHACDICGKPGRETTVYWKAKVEYEPKQSLFHHIVVRPFILIGMLALSQDSPTKIKRIIKFGTTHTLCNQCSPGIMRKLASVLFSCVCVLLMLALLGGITVGILLCVVGCYKTLHLSPFQRGLVGLFAAILIGLWIWGISVYLRLETAIRLPEHFRILARGPFDVDKSRAVKNAAKKVSTAVEITKFR